MVTYLVSASSRKSWKRLAKAKLTLARRFGNSNVELVNVKAPVKDFNLIRFGSHLVDTCDC